MVQQIPLSIGFPQRATFGNFIAGLNDQAADALRTWVHGGLKGELFYLWGSESSGRSHLLAAACNDAEQKGLPFAYLPLRDHETLSPRMLDGLENRFLVALDDVDAVAGNTAWETALFHLYNRLRDAGRRILVSADRGPLELPLLLPDLKTRLAWGLCYRLTPLDEDGKRRLLHRQASERGLQLSPEAAEYLLAHFPRDAASLVRLMERLDAAALAAQRRLTIPFLRSQIRNQDSP